MFIQGPLACLLPYNDVIFRGSYLGLPTVMRICCALRESGIEAKCGIEITCELVKTSMETEECSGSWGGGGGAEVYRVVERHREMGD